jgi:hypothetical protein
VRSLIESHCEVGCVGESPELAGFSTALQHALVPAPPALAFAANLLLPAAGLPRRGGLRRGFRCRTMARRRLHKRVGTRAQAPGALSRCRRSPPLDALLPFVFRWLDVEPPELAHAKTAHAARQFDPERPNVIGHNGNRDTLCRTAPRLAENAAVGASLPAPSGLSGNDLASSPDARKTPLSRQSTRLCQIDDFTRENHN